MNEKTKSRYNNGTHLRLTDDNHVSLNRVINLLEVSPSAIVNYVLKLTLTDLEKSISENMSANLKDAFKLALKNSLNYKPHEN